MKNFVIICFFKWFLSLFYSSKTTQIFFFPLASLLGWRYIDFLYNDIFMKIYTKIFIYDFLNVELLKSNLEMSHYKFFSSYNWYRIQLIKIFPSESCELSLDYLRFVVSFSHQTLDFVMQIAVYVNIQQFGSGTYC